MIDPAASRLLLEAANWLSKAKPESMNPDWAQLPIALAMAPLDFDRALEIAHAIPNEQGAGFDAQRKLAQFLLAPDEVRKTIPLDRWNCSDTWKPGTPTNW